MTTETPPVTFVDDPHAPEIFASGAAGFFILGSNLVITFESIRVDHTTSPGPLNRVVCARVVLPIGTAQGLTLGLHDFLSKHGYDPFEAVTAGVTKQ